MALVGVLIGPRIGPFSQRSLDEALGLAVGALRVAVGEAVLQAQFSMVFCQPIRAISWPVVGEDDFEVDAQPSIIGQRRMKKSNHQLPFFVGIDGGEGDARVVINGDNGGVHILPTRAGNMVGAIR